MNDCQIIAEPQDATSYIKHLFWLDGDSANSRTADVHLKRCEFSHPLGAEPDEASFYMDDGTFARVYDCAFDRANFSELHEQGVAGTNTIVGLASAADATAHKNALGVYVTSA